MQTLHSFSETEDTRLTLLRQGPKVDDIYELYCPEPETVSDSGSQEELDKKTKNPKIVVNKQQSMEDLVLALERALSMAKQPAAKAGEVISYVREQFENIENPHRALEQELAMLIEANTPPNGELYNLRAEKSESTVAFFHRVYGRFFDAGILYRHQLLRMDAALVNALGHHKSEIKLKTKKDYITAVAGSALQGFDGIENVILAVKRRQYS